jgi:hypothetical protein
LSAAVKLPRTRAVALAAAAAALACGSLVACQLVLGVRDEDGAPREAGAEGGASAEGGPPTCGKQPPPPPQPSELPDATDGVAFIVAFREFKINPPNTALGYDLDGRCTTKDSDASDLPCTNEAGLVVDDPGGIDNAFVREVISTFIAAKDGEAPDPAANTLNVPLAEGRRTILVSVVGYNGEANDAHVKVGVASSERFERGGECAPGLLPPIEAGAFDDAGDPPLPRWDGCDAWTYTPGTLVVNGTPSATYDGYVHDHVLVVTAPTLTLSYYSMVLPFSEALMTATIVADPATASYFLRDGVITGRIRTEPLFTAAGALAHLACNDGKRALLRSVVCAARDIPERKAADGTRAACDAISFALGFSAEPARLGHEGPAAPALLCDASPTPCE